MNTKIIRKDMMNRRLFLRLAGGTVGVVAFELMFPGHRLSPASETIFPESSCGGESKMNGKLLVAYATKYGSTGGVAEAISKELCNNGSSVDLRLAKDVTDLSPYRAVIVGSPIYRGKWMSDAVDFVGDNSGILSKVPVAYFVVCMTMRDPTEKNRQEALAYMESVRKSVPEVKPVKIGLFAGALDYSKISWLMRKILKSKWLPEGDCRDWKTIRAWASGLNEIQSMANSLRVA